MNVLPMTQEAAREIFKGLPPKSVRGLVFEAGGRLLAGAGLYMEFAHQVLFFDGNMAEVRKSPRALVRAMRRIMHELAVPGVPIYAHADQGMEASERFLEHHGFRHHAGRVYKWPG